WVLSPRALESAGRLGMRLLLVGLCLLLVTLGGCGRSPSTESYAEQLAEPIRSPVTTAEFVVCIDNSASIRPPEQVLIREATMLLADLADEGDRISVITFGETAQIVASVLIAGDADRDEFKRAVERGVDFREQYSDIRAGLELLAHEREHLFPTETSLHAAILFTDGRLEPPNHQTMAAFQQIQRLLAGPLQGLPIYAVLLGNTTSSQTIPGLGITGHQLMARHIARTPGYFYHAEHIDQLLDAAVFILKKTKGVSSLGEEGGTTFRIDRTVKTMILIVRKLSTDGTRLAHSHEIELQPPSSEDRIFPEQPSGPRPGRSPEAIYQNRDYTSFDLFVVRNPREGLWKVSLTNGEVPSVLSRIVTPIHLVVDARATYYLNEAAKIRAWLVDDELQEISRDTYRLSAHMGAQGALATSKAHSPMEHDSLTGQYHLAVPHTLVAVIGDESQMGTVDVEVIAQRMQVADDDQLDPWFVRRSPRMTIEVQAPLVSWLHLPVRIEPIPLRPSSFALGAELDTRNPFYTEFEVPPQLAIEIEKLDENQRRYVSWMSQTVDAAAQEHALLYQVPLDLTEWGSYRYRYRLLGQTRAGEFAIASPWFDSAVVFPWRLAAAALLVVVLLLHLVGILTVRLQGQVRISIDHVGHTVRVPPRRSFDSRRDNDHVRPVEEQLRATRFLVRPVRTLLVSKRLQLKMLAGSANVDGRRTVRQGSAVRLGVGRHTLRFHDGGKEIEVQLHLSV
ncbi:MAG: VWA domain-containing protein, partial [Candidatus Eisenbacteria sp.]|nr:VWA domain-containing protein [Candidatus Eisenbacteria bacterium]